MNNREKPDKFIESHTSHRARRRGVKGGICGIDDWNVITRSRTTACCSEEATMPVHNLSGDIIGYACPRHAKETEQLIQAINGYVTARFVSYN